MGAPGTLVWASLVLIYCALTILLAVITIPILQGRVTEAPEGRLLAPGHFEPKDPSSGIHALSHFLTRPLCWELLLRAFIYERSYYFIRKLGW